MKKALKIVIAILAGTVAAIYAGGCVFFYSHQYPNTTVDHTEAGRLTAEEAVDLAEQDMAARDITIKSKDKTYAVSGSDILSLSDRDAAVKSISSRNYPAWPWEIFRDHELTTGGTLTCDRETLKKNLEPQGIFADSATPVNAEISEFQTGTGYAIIPDSNGYRVNEDDALTYIALKIEEGLSEIDITDRCQVKADVTKDNEKIVRDCAALNKLIHYNLLISFRGNSVALNGDTLHNWIVPGTDGSPVLDTAMVASYSDAVQDIFSGNFASEQNITGFRYIVDAGQLSDILTKKLTDAPDATSSDAIEIPVLEADPSFDLQYGLNYIDVDIANQKVTLFRDAKIAMQSSCVTGLPTKDRRTHTGVFKINYKQRNRILTGQNDEYHSFVSYWMPFDEGRGLHDATWRGKFGGNIYRYGGSHGCVNLPSDFARNLYAQVYTGETVVVH